MLRLRLPVIFACLLLAQWAGGQATTQASPQKWVVQVIPIEESKARGAVEGEHVLVIEDDALRVEGPLGERFGPAPFVRRGADFRAQLSEEFRGVVLWAGEFLDDGTIHGYARHTQRDGQILTYRFSGRRGT